MRLPPKLRRSLRRARLRTWRAVRTYPSLAVTAVVLAVAAAMGLGAFQPSHHETARATTRPATTNALQPVDPYVTPSQPFGAAQPTLVMTYYLVDTPELSDAFNRMKDELRFREYLSRSYFEVLLIQTPEDEARAQALIARQREVPLGAFVVEDLRKK